MYQEVVKRNYSYLKPDEFNHAKKLYKYTDQELQVQGYLLK